jgi:hypothetical protein
MIKILVVLLCAAIPKIALAFWGPLIFSPSSPTTDDIIRFQISFGVCDAFASNNDSVIEISAQTIRVTKFGVSVTDPALCNFNNGTTTTTLGVLPVGTYQVELYRRDIQVQTTVVLVRTGTVSVSSAGSSALATIPTVSKINQMLLALLLILVGVWRAHVVAKEMP